MSTKGWQKFWWTSCLTQNFHICKRHQFSMEKREILTFFFLNHMHSWTFYTFLCNLFYKAVSIRHIGMHSSSSGLHCWCKVVQRFLVLNVFFLCYISHICGVKRVECHTRKPKHRSISYCCQCNFSSLCTNGLRMPLFSEKEASQF